MAESAAVMHETGLNWITRFTPREGLDGMPCEAKGVSGREDGGTFCQHECSWSKLGFHGGFFHPSSEILHTSPAADKHTNRLWLRRRGRDGLPLVVCRHHFQLTCSRLSSMLLECTECLMWTLISHPYSVVARCAFPFFADLWEECTAVGHPRIRPSQSCKTYSKKFGSIIYTRPQVTSPHHHPPLPSSQHGRLG